MPIESRLLYQGVGPPGQELTLTLNYDNMIVQWWSISRDSLFVFFFFSSNWCFCLFFFIRASGICSEWINQLAKSLCNPLWFRCVTFKTDAVNRGRGNPNANNINKNVLSWTTWTKIYWEIFPSENEKGFNINYFFLLLC